MAGLNDFVTFNQFAQSAATEVIDQYTGLWNQATNNAMVLRSAANIGDFSEESQYSLIADLYGNRNAYSTAALASVDLTQLLETSVKVGCGSKPVEYTGTSFDWTQRPADEAGTVFGTQVGMAKMQYMVNAAIAAAVASTTTTGLEYDGTAGIASLQSLNSASRLFGDRAQAIRTWIMHSKSMHDIYENALNNSERLFTFDNVQVMTDGFGRTLVMTDSPNLFFDNGGTDNYYQIGLVEGAMVVEDNGDSRVYTETKTEFDNAKQLIKEESSFNIGVKGMTWDKTNGGKSPNDAAVALSTNWDQSATQVKDTLGVRAVTL
jgi:hypothetical protein